MPQKWGAAGLRLGYLSNFLTPLVGQERRNSGFERSVRALLLAMQQPVASSLQSSVRLMFLGENLWTNSAKMSRLMHTSDVCSTLKDLLMSLVL